MQLTESTMLTKGTVMQIKKLQKNVCVLISNVSRKFHTLGIYILLQFLP